MNLFIGAFNDLDSHKFSGSGAGAKVQSEIIDALNLCGKEIEALVMPEVPSWPRGHLITDHEKVRNVRYLSVLNISFLKRFSFFAQVFLFVLKKRYNSIFFYNSSLSSCFFSFFFKLLGCKRVLILQDVLVPDFDDFLSYLSPTRILSFLHIKILPLCYNLYIPITGSCITDLNLPDELCDVFPGAVPLNRLRQWNTLESGLSNYAVFAGALEAYNGVDLLLENWPLHNEVSFELHIFGSGSLSHLAEIKSQENRNVIYHGFKSPDVVDNYILKSRINFCFRYSKGIKQNFYFPSKFFDLIMLPGFLVCNRFNNIPAELCGYVHFVDDDFSGASQLFHYLSSSERDVDGLYEKIQYKYTWQGFLMNYCKRNSL